MFHTETDAAAATAAASRPATCPQRALAVRRAGVSNQGGVYPDEATRCDVGLERAATTLAPPIAQR